MRRPRTLLGLTWRLLRLRPSLVVIPVGVFATITLLCLRPAPDNSPTTRPTQPISIATFNIENYPKHATQVKEAFALMASLDSGLIGVQEITDPVHFRDAMRERLGGEFDFIHTTPKPGKHPPLLNGLLVNRGLFSVDRVTERSEVQIDGRGRPALVVQLEGLVSGQPLTVIVIHLRSGSAGVDTRKQQLAGLTTILRDYAHEDNVVVLGDFNATETADRNEIAKVAARSDLHWATEPIACSAFWNRDQDCPRSRLDHILSRTRPAVVQAKGGCETFGCDTEASCPAYIEYISDHCPVVARWR